MPKKAENLVGRRFGRLTVLEQAGRNESGRLQWLCRCDCGNTCVVRGSNLQSGSTKSCGCLFHDRELSIIRERFGRLMVVGKAGRNKSGALLVKCQCDCGNECVVFATNIREGHTQSCGCLHSERVKEAITKTGESATLLHKTWYSMIRRCTNPKVKNFHRYGGRGITVCDEWLHSFYAFKEWALANGYKEHLSIDRIDNEKGYSPDNCQWITSAENSRKTKMDREKLRKEKEVHSDSKNKKSSVSGN